MRITCPSCAAEYDLAAALAAGKVVRCVRCSHEWAPVVAPRTEWPDRIALPEPPQPEPLLPEPLMPETLMPETPPAPLPFMTLQAGGRAPVRAASGRGVLALAWISSGLLLAALVAAGYVFRAPIMQTWPPSTRLFAALGLA